MKYDMVALRAVQKLDADLLEFLAPIYGMEGIQFFCGHALKGATLVVLV